MGNMMRILRELSLSPLKSKSKTEINNIAKDDNNLLLKVELISFLSKSSFLRTSFLLYSLFSFNIFN